MAFADDHEREAEGPSGCPDLPGVDSNADCSINRERRRNRVDLDADGFRFASRAIGNGVRDLLALNWRGIGNRMEIDWRVRRIDSDDVDAFRFRWRFFGLLQYEKAANATNNAFDQDVDTFCGVYPIRGDAFRWSGSQSTIDNATVTTITASSQFVDVIAHLPGGYNADAEAREFRRDNITIVPRARLYSSVFLLWRLTAFLFLQ